MPISAQEVFLCTVFNHVQLPHFGIKPTEDSCSNFRDKSKDFVALENLYRKVRSKVRHNDWLPRHSPTKAFIICVAQGPWKFERREKITKTALKEVGSRDMNQIGSITAFPFTWQQGLVSNLNAYLVRKNLTMNQFMVKLRKLHARKGSAKARQLWYNACGAPTGPKVLSLFLRDWARIPSFPIDRHVKRMLVKHKLPIHEAALVQLCDEINIDAMSLAVGTVRVGSGGAIG
jgi:hypothetical protein